VIAAVLKALRESWPSTAIFGVGLALVSGIIAYVLPSFAEEQTSVWLQVPLARNVLSALLGMPVDDTLTGAMLRSIVWTHPVVLAMIWAHEIILCSRTPAAEIDRGTIDVLLGLPLRRRTILLAESAVWLATGVVLIGAIIVGTHVGSSIAGVTPPTPVRLALVIANLLALYAAVGAFAFLVSSVSSRRGRAIGVVLGVLLASFLLNFLVPFWKPAERVAFLGVLDHYRPARILTGRGNGVAGTLTLLSIGLVCWGGALIAFARRSITTL